jgi:hypothetical protein
MSASRALLLDPSNKEFTVKRTSIFLVVIMGLSLLGCAGMSDTEQRTLSGAAIGAGAGTIVGAIAGDAGWGAAIGAAAGAAGGYLHDRNVKSREEAYRRGYEEGRQKQ